MSEIRLTANGEAQSVYGTSFEKSSPVPTTVLVKVLHLAIEIAATTARSLPTQAQTSLRRQTSRLT